MNYTKLKRLFFITTAFLVILFTNEIDYAEESTRTYHGDQYVMYSAEEYSRERPSGAYIELDNGTKLVKSDYGSSYYFFTGGSKGKPEDICDNYTFVGTGKMR